MIPNPDNASPPQLGMAEAMRPYVDEMQAMAARWIAYDEKAETGPAFDAMREGRFGAAAAASALVGMLANILPMADKFTISINAKMRDSK